jgi:hypothetical protein
VPVTVIAGESGAHITAVGVEGEDPRDFSVASDGCTGSSLSVGARCQITVAVEPRAGGVRNAQLVVTNSSGAQTSTALAIFAEPGGSAEPVETGETVELGRESPPASGAVAAPTSQAARFKRERRATYAFYGSASAAAAPTPVRCVVPELRRRTLAKVKRLLAAGHCRLGRVRRARGPRSDLIVARQYPARGSVLLYGAPVAVSMARRH